MLSTSWTGGGTYYGGCAGRHAAFTPQTGYNYCDATTFYEPIFWPALVMGTETVMADVPGRMTQSSRIGVFGTVNRGMTFGEIRDGLSNTAMIGELQRITAWFPSARTAGPSAGRRPFSPTARCIDGSAQSPFRRCRPAKADC